MSKINTIIRSSNFEIVRDKIAQILSIEYANQKVLISEYLSNPPIESTPEDIKEVEFALTCIPTRVWVERFTRPTPQEIESTWLNVMFTKRKPASLNSTSNQYTESLFVIECWARGAYSMINGSMLHGDSLSSLKLARTLGVVSKILKAKCYKFLDLSTLVGTIDTSAILIMQPEYGAKTEENLIFGTLGVNVEINELSLECSYQGVVCVGVDTTVKVNDESGIYWETNLI